MPHRCQKIAVFTTGLKLTPKDAADLFRWELEKPRE